MLRDRSALAQKKYLPLSTPILRPCPPCMLSTAPRTFCMFLHSPLSRLPFPHHPWGQCMGIPPLYDSRAYRLMRLLGMFPFPLFPIPFSAPIGASLLHLCWQLSTPSPLFSYLNSLSLSLHFPLLADLCMPSRRACTAVARAAQVYSFLWLGLASSLCGAG